MVRMEIIGLAVAFVGTQPQSPMLQPGKGNRGLDHMGFRVDNLDKTLEELKAKGVTLNAGPGVTGSGLKYAFINGPEGIRIELIEKNKGNDNLSLLFEDAEVYSRRLRKKSICGDSPSSFRNCRGAHLWAPNLGQPHGVAPTKETIVLMTFYEIINDTSPGFPREPCGPRFGPPTALPQDGKIFFNGRP